MSFGKFTIGLLIGLVSPLISKMKVRRNIQLKYRRPCLKEYNNEIQYKIAKEKGCMPKSYEDNTTELLSVI